jgi:hypothetical protein
MDATAATAATALITTDGLISGTHVAGATLSRFLDFTPMPPVMNLIANMLR